MYRYLYPVSLPRFHHLFHLASSAKKVKRKRPAELEVKHLQNAELHPQHLLLCVGLVRDVDEILHLNQGLHIINKEQNPTGYSSNKLGGKVRLPLVQKSPRTWKRPAWRPPRPAAAGCASSPPGLAPGI